MKKCINCGNELFDEAVICPKCKTEQPVDGKAGLPSSEIRVKNRKKHKAYLKVIIAVISFFIAVILIAALFLCGWQIKRADYIDNQLSTWITDIEEGDFDTVRNSIDKYNIEEELRDNEFLFSVWGTLFPDNMESVTKLFCKEWDTYKDIVNIYDDLEFVDICYDYYESWENGELDSALVNAAKSYYSTLKWLCLDAGVLRAEDEGYGKYDWFKPYYDKAMEFMPTAENVSGSVYVYDSFSSYSGYAEITLTNNNFYPIDISDIAAEVNITLMMIRTYGAPDYLRINEPLDLENLTENDSGNGEGIINGEESLSFDFDMNIEERYYSSYIAYMQYDSSVSVTDAESV